MSIRAWLPFCRTVFPRGEFARIPLIFQPPRSLLRKEVRFSVTETTFRKPCFLVKTVGRWSQWYGVNATRTHLFFHHSQALERHISYRNPGESAGVPLQKLGPLVDYPPVQYPKKYLAEGILSSLSGKTRLSPLSHGVGNLRINCRERGNS